MHSFLCIHCISPFCGSYDLASMSNFILLLHQRVENTASAWESQQ